MSFSFCVSCRYSRWQADCEYLVPQLTSYLESMSSFEEYRVEVMSGQLEWSPVHRSERFWRENINNINDKHGELVKVLARLLETSPTYDVRLRVLHLSHRFSQSPCTIWDSTCASTLVESRSWKRWVRRPRLWG